MNAVAAGNGDTQTSSTFAMDGFDSVCVVAELGPVVDAAVATLRVQDGSLSNGSDAANISGASAALTGATSSNTNLVVDVQRPQTEYITVTLQRATQNITINGITAYLYNAKNVPVTQPASVSASAIVLANS
jgi:uncharacterized Zn-binding protein involved in type VI secretion